jgi:hypothetical protein
MIDPKKYDFYYLGISIKDLSKDELIELVKFLMIEKSENEKKYFELLKTLFK